jgi:hypothetical protein
MHQIRKLEIGMDNIEATANCADFSQRTLLESVASTNNSCALINTAAGPDTEQNGITVTEFLVHLKMTPRQRLPVDRLNKKGSQAIYYFYCSLLL